MKLVILIILFSGLYSACAQDTTVHGKDSVKARPAKKQKPYGPEWNPEDQVSRYIRRMMQDKDGNIWFGTQGDGACRYNGTDFKYFRQQDGLAGNVIRGMLQDENGDIWFATNGGVSRYNPASATFFNLGVKDGLSDPQVWCLIKDKSGMFWFGTEQGVNRYDPKSGQINDFPLPAADLAAFPGAYPAPKLVNCIFQDREGLIWLGSNGLGVYTYDGVSLLNMSEKDSLCNNFVQTIIQDRAGDLWFGTRFGGICRYRKSEKQFTRFTEKEGLNGTFVWTIYEDTWGKLWIGTAGAGLSAYDPVTGKFTSYSSNSGMINQYVQSIMQDKRNVLWVGTSGGAFMMFGERFYNFIKREDQ